jgi:alkylation response protein AidB-like acyl-CoA dehydrogenase
MAGALSGALAEVTEHVSNRRQFGRPIGSFQAVQHRLAACATQSAAGKWLALRAASTGSTEDALVAAGHLQAHARTILYDLHQFMGAMGLTLEHPLYGYTYRVRLLMTELGGAPAQFRRLAETAWG